MPSPTSLGQYRYQSSTLPSVRSRITFWVLPISLRLGQATRRIFCTGTIGSCGVPSALCLLSHVLQKHFDARCVVNYLLEAARRARAPHFVEAGGASLSRSSRGLYTIVMTIAGGCIRRLRIFLELGDS